MLDLRVLSGSGLELPRNRLGIGDIRTMVLRKCMLPIQMRLRRLEVKHPGAISVTSSIPETVRLRIVLVVEGLDTQFRIVELGCQKRKVRVKPDVLNAEKKDISRWKC